MLNPLAFTRAFAAALGSGEDGQTIAEYGVVLSVITLLVIGSITLLSDNVVSALESVATVLPG